MVSAVVLAFLIPLGLLVRTMATDAATSGASEAARSVATLVAGVDDPASLPAALGTAGNGAGRSTYVSLPDGTRVGDIRQAQAGSALVTRARTEATGVTVVTDDRVDVLIPVGTPQGVAVVHTSADLAAVTRGVHLAWLTLALLGVGMIAVSTWVAAVMAGRIATPVTAMAHVAHRLRSGEVDARAVPAGPAEVVELGTALNQLADRIDELVRLERENVADVSHRLRTPVTALRLDTDLVADVTVRERLRGHVEQLQRSIDAVVADARRPTRGVLRPGCDASAVVAARIAHWGPLAEDQGRRVDVALPPYAPVSLPEQDLTDLVDNLIDNVFAHTAEGVAYGVRLALADGMATLTVEDAGAGGPLTVVPERGVSGGDGTGLGLDIARRLAREGGGDLTLQRSSLGGLAAVVRLRQPATDPARRR